MRIRSFEMDMRKRAPRIAPTTDPKAVGPAIGGTILPRTRYVPALAAAVTQIMKFEVADETFIGGRNAVSRAGTLRTPLTDTQKRRDQTGTIHQDHPNRKTLNPIAR
jgi:hypothetical protein